MHGRADRSHLPRLGPTIFAVTDCLFCAIVAGEIPATLVVETDRVLAFRDINPQAPIHVVVISKTHYPDVAALAAADDALLGELLRQAHYAATAEGIGQAATASCSTRRPRGPGGAARPRAPARRPVPHLAARMSGRPRTADTMVASALGGGPPGLRERRIDR